MGYGYGIEIARNTLWHLSSKEDIEWRMVKGFSEIGVITDLDNDPDTTPENMAAIREFEAQYLALSTPRDEKELQKLSVELVGICVDIIEENASAKALREDI